MNRCIFREEDTLLLYYRIPWRSVDKSNVVIIYNIAFKMNFSMIKPENNMIIEQR